MVQIKKGSEGLKVKRHLTINVAAAVKEEFVGKGGSELYYSFSVMIAATNST